MSVCQKESGYRFVQSGNSLRLDSFHFIKVYRNEPPTQGLILQKLPSLQTLLTMYISDNSQRILIPIASIYYLVVFQQEPRCILGRRADCSAFKHQADLSCQLTNHCEDGAQCPKNHHHRCPSSTTCTCPDYSIGARF